ncbi:argininosuccinate lyase [Metasolibacillus meyeri]|uniref:Argininosuccinate lyase n=1 Tax=Metasolibacillus meyeri TaxID=1071052 RepID=A0AAW9NN05_9BACL|nr:argininosuccinate lyase [Metasolibacillus meyeri]MEC1178982.1 argininosuccinate lyase [Metasolibacillus meyeri]
MKLWGGRFRNEENSLMEEFNSSLEIDQRLYFEDITGSLAHVKMLVQCEILSSVEGELISDGLKGILADIESSELPIEGDYEDIHSFVEMNLIKRIGDVGKKLHTARSRNDQTAVDTRMYARKKAREMVEVLEAFKQVLKDKAEENPYIMPGYTHLQRAQVVTFKHHLMAYYQMFNRDQKRVQNALELLNENPLGCGALAGTTHSIDRMITTQELGFTKPVDNFMDGVSERDYVLELTSDFSIIMMHLSRMSEELILWCSQEFKFIEIDDAYATGSSIMPQKKNPDAAELIRGKTGKVYGALFSIFTMMKGIPLTYNKDMQEEKESFFYAIDTTLASLKIMTEMIRTLKVNEEKMRASVKQGFLNATELADYLVKAGTPFRDAHSIVGKVVIYCEDHNKGIEDLTLQELQQFSDAIQSDIYEYIDYDSILNKGTKVHLR